MRSAVLWHSLDGGKLTVHYLDLTSLELRTHTEEFSPRILTDGLGAERAEELLRENRERGIPTTARTLEGLVQLAAQPDARGLEHALAPEFVVSRNASHTPRTRWLDRKHELEHTVSATERLGFRDASFFGTGFRGGHKEYLVEHRRRYARVNLSPMTVSEFSDFVEEVKQDEALFDSYQIYGLRLHSFKDEKDAERYIKDNKRLLTPRENNARPDIARLGTGFEAVSTQVIRFVATYAEANRLWRLRLEHNDKPLTWESQGYTSSHSYPDPLGQGHRLLQAQMRYKPMRTLEGERLTDEEFLVVREWWLKNTGYLDIETRRYLKFMPRSGDIAQIGIGNERGVVLLNAPGCSTTPDFALPDTRITEFRDELAGTQLAWEEARHYPFIMTHYGNHYDLPMLRRINTNRSVAETEMIIGRLRRLRSRKRKPLTKPQLEEVTEEAYRLHAQTNLLRALYGERGKVWGLGEGPVHIDMQGYWRQRRDALRTDTRLVTVTLRRKEGVQDYDELDDNYSTEEGRRLNHAYLRQDLLLLGHAHRDVATAMLLEIEDSGVGIDKFYRKTPYENARAARVKERRERHGRHLVEHARRPEMLAEQRADLRALIRYRLLGFARQRQRFFEGWSLYYNPLIISSQRHLLAQREGLLERARLVQGDTPQAKLQTLQYLEAVASPVVGLISRTLENAEAWYAVRGEKKRGRHILRLAELIEEPLFESFRTERPERPWKANSEDLDALLAEKTGFDVKLYEQYLLLQHSFQRLREKGFVAQAGTLYVSPNAHPELPYYIGTGNIAFIRDRAVADIGGRPLLYRLQMHKGEEDARDEMLAAVREARVPEYRHTPNEMLNGFQLELASAIRGQIQLL